MNYIWKSKNWFCDRCKHYISGDYKECPYCKVLAKEAKANNLSLIMWKREKSYIARQNSFKKRLSLEKTGSLFSNIKGGQSGQLRT